VREALATVATKAGRELGASAGSLDAALESCGYEPCDDGAGGLVLTNCPFHRLATSHTEVICQANVALLSGVAEGAAEDARTVEFVPPTGEHCCVRIAAR
jgi:predicted ArsR family transcriptional regulator